MSGKHHLQYPFLSLLLHSEIQYSGPCAPDQPLLLPVLYLSHHQAHLIDLALAYVLDDLGEDLFDLDHCALFRESSNEVSHLPETRLFLELIVG